MRPGERERVRRRARLEDGVAAAFELLADQRPQHHLVLDEQDRLAPARGLARRLGG